jgi:hypothetical protein
MTGFTEQVLLIATCAVVLTTAMDPEPGPQSYVPSWLMVGGKQTIDPALPDSWTEFFVVLRDLAGNPVPGADIVIDFENCTDLHLCSANVGGQTVDCANRIVHGTTDATGHVSFWVLGAGALDNPPHPPDVAPGAGSGCARVFADGVQFGFSTVVIFDLDGVVPPLGVGPSSRNGVKGSDLPIVLTEVGAGNSGAPYRGRSDYSQDYSVNGFDLATFLTILGESNSGFGSGNGCSNDTGQAVPYCP